MNTDSESNDGLRMSLRERPRKLHAERKLRQQNDELKYLDELDEKAARAKRKLNNNKKKQSHAYDEFGRIRYNGMDVCDCMDDDCPGCYFACENCGSTKCGVQCRVNRRFFYDSISFDGKDATIKNKYCLSK